MTLVELEYNLKIVADLLNEKCEWFLFFGSLLGITRDKKLIQDDDDIDIYVDRKNYKLIREILSDNGFEIDYNNSPNHTEYFIQVKGVFNDKYICIDFYFYSNNIDSLFIEELWNYSGDSLNACVLRIPKIFIFRVKHVKTLY